jgi:hypothetical protein
VVAQTDTTMMLLAGSLYRKTQAGAIRWRRTDEPGTYLYSSQSGIVLLERGSGVGSPTLRVLDDRGIVVEEYSGNDLNLSSLLIAVDDQLLRAETQLGRLLAEVEFA